MRKGIFWVVNDSEEYNLLSIEAECDIEGNSLDSEVEFSSKSGNNFNHRVEWDKLSHSVTKGKPFNYYPRGRVEIKNGKVRIYINPDAYNETVFKLIIKNFCLEECFNRIRIVIDNSAHYQYAQDR